MLEFLSVLIVSCLTSNHPPLGTGIMLCISVCRFGCGRDTLVEHHVLHLKGHSGQHDPPKKHSTSPPPPQANSHFQVIYRHSRSLPRFTAVNHSPKLLPQASSTTAATSNCQAMYQPSLFDLIKNLKVATPLLEIQYLPYSLSDDTIQTFWANSYSIKINWYAYSLRLSPSPKQ